MQCVDFHYDGMSALSIKGFREDPDHQLLNSEEHKVHHRLDKTAPTSKEMQVLTTPTTAHPAP